MKSKTSGCNFNDKHYFEVFKQHPRKEQYCFALKMFLGENGLFPDHPLKGRIFVNNEGEEFSVDNVYVHYWGGGYYYVALAQNKHRSHAQISWNINCPVPEYTCNIENYKLLS